LLIFKEWLAQAEFSIGGRSFGERSDFLFEISFGDKFNQHYCGFGRSSAGSLLRVVTGLTLCRIME
jgi:hypothetical protein